MKHFLTVNKLLGKIQLNSSMGEDEIFDEIRSVFHVPMHGDSGFLFKILQPSGDDSRSLMIPELSHSYWWTASAVAGRNAKTLNLYHCWWTIRGMKYYHIAGKFGGEFNLVVWRLAWGPPNLIFSKFYICQNFVEYHLTVERTRSEVWTCKDGKTDLHSRGR